MVCNGTGRPEPLLASIARKRRDYPCLTQ